MDLFGLGAHEFYHAKPPTEAERNATPPWRKKRANMPPHLKLAMFWRCDLLEPSTTEEILNITFCRPTTARQHLKIDIYAARGLFKCFQIRTIESLARVIKSQMHLRGNAYVEEMLMEALHARQTVADLVQTFGCLQDDKSMSEAVHSWNNTHPYTSMGDIVPNEVAVTKSSDLVKSEQNRAMIAELRRQQEDHHHHTTHKSNVHMPATFFAAANSTDKNKTGKNKEESGGLDDLLFEESDGEEEINPSSDYGLSMSDARMFDFNEEAMRIAGAYRLACKKYKTLPISKVLRQLDEDELDVADLHLQHLNIQAICDTVPHLNRLHVLNLSKNNLKQEGGLALAEAMRENLRRLQILDLSDNKLGSEAGCALSDSFFFMHALRSLNLSKNGLGNAVLQSLASSLIGVKSKSFSLDLSYNDFDCAGMLHLASYMATPTCCLERANLEWNQVGPVGCQHLADALLLSERRTPMRMTELNLSFNKIGCDGFCTLIELLLNDTGVNASSLQNINLAHNNIRAASGYMFSSALKLCIATTALTSLNLSDNPVTLPVVNAILRTVDLAQNKVNVIVHNTFSTSTPVSGGDVSVPDLDCNKVNLDLADKKDHCFAEIVRARIGKSMARLLYAHEGRKPVTAHTLAKSFGRVGILSIKVENTHSLASQENSPALRHHHGPLNLTLDLKCPLQKEVAIAHLITHHEKRMGVDPKNMSNAIHMEVAAEEQDLVVRHPLYNGKPFPHTRDFFSMLRKGLITYELSESALKLFSTITCDMSVVSNRNAIEGVVRRVQEGGGGGDYIHKCTWNGKIVDVDKMSTDSDYFKDLEAAVAKDSAKNAKNDEAGGVQAVVGRPMKSMRKSFYLPTRGEFALQVHSDHPVCVLAEYVSLDLRNLEERNLAYVYLWRARCVVGEGLLDLLLDDRKRGAGAGEDGFVFPDECQMVTFIYIVSRPNKGLVAGKVGDSVKARRGDSFALDLGKRAEREKALLLRKLCLGENGSIRSVWSGAVLRGEGGDVGKEEFLYWGKVVTESCWRIPESGLLTFKFIPCISGGVKVEEGWLAGTVEVLRGCGSDIARVDVCRGVREGKYILNVAKVGKILECVESSAAKREAFGLLLGRVSDVLNGGLELAGEVGGWDGGKRGLELLMMQSIGMVQSPRRDEKVPGGPLLMGGEEGQGEEKKEEEGGEVREAELAGKKKKKKKRGEREVKC